MKWVRFLYFTLSGKMIPPVDYDKLCTYNEISTAMTIIRLQQSYNKKYTEKHSV